MYKKLLNKGFQRFIYSDHKDPKVFYRFDVIDNELKVKIIKHVGANIENWLDRLDNCCITIETTENLMLTQYSINTLDKNVPFDFEHDELTLEEFNDILDILEDKNVIVKNGYVINN